MGTKLIEGIDFYFEGRFMVFTEKFLRERGYCCESGCRHCPYGFRRDQRADVPVDAAAGAPGDGDGDKSAS